MRFILILLLLSMTSLSFSQEIEDSAPHTFVGLDVFHGTLLKHNKNVAHLIHEHPQGFLLSYNFKTDGSKRWHQEYNYPDYGITFLYNDFRFEPLGTNFSLGFHYNFYFLNRNLIFRIGEGINYNTNPFDFDSNDSNISYGSHLTGFTQLALQYVKPRVIGSAGVRAGISFLHHSNGGFKAPNSGTNVLAFSAGVTYDLNEDEIVHTKQEVLKTVKEPIKFNVALRGGINASDYYNLGEHPFYILSTYVDKRLSYKNTIQLGTELFLSRFLISELEYAAASGLNRNVPADADYKRVGVFVGHEFRFGQVALPTQLGYYVYRPSQYASSVYLRAGVKYYITDKWFVDGTVKAHSADAEAIEFGLGYRI